MKFNIFRWNALCAFAWVFGSTAVFAQTNVDPAQPINTPTTWTLAGSPYIIGAGNVTVNSVLTIEAGVVIKFSGPYTLIISGTQPAPAALIAMGTDQDKITFTAVGDAAVEATLLFESFSADATFDGNGAYASGSILENVIIEKLGGNHGALELNGAHPFINKAIIRNNGSTGIYAYNLSAVLRIENCDIDSNSSVAVGGGAHIVGSAGSDVRVSRCMIRNNTTQGHGGGAYITTLGNVTLDSNTIDNNQAGNRGGGLYLDGSGTTTSKGNVVSGNFSGGRGGGIFAQFTTVALTSDVISDNEAGSNGGGISTISATLTAATSKFVRNKTASAMGGGAYFDGGAYSFSHTVFVLNNSTTNHAGAVDFHNSAMGSFNYCILASNYAEDYGSAISYSDGSGSITNSVITQNTGSTPLSMYGNVSVANNSIVLNPLNPGNSFFGGTIGISPTSNSTINSNNIMMNGTYYDITSGYNGTVNATSNWWGTTDTATIAGRITFTGASPPQFVDTTTTATGPYIGNPISPPTGVSVANNGSTFSVSWNPNPESDVMGYKVYWGTKAYPDLENSVEVTNVTQYDFPALTGGNYWVAVTAIDVDYPANPDLPATPTNESQTRGHESWFSEVKPMTIVEADLRVEIAALENNPSADINGLRDGDLMNYRITVTNDGPSDAVSGMEITLSVPAGITLNGCGVTDGQTVTCTHAPLKLKEQVSIDIVGKIGTVNANVPATVNVSSADDDPSTSNNQAGVSICVNCPDLATTWKTAPTSSGISLTTDYVVSVKNQNRTAASDVVLDIALPAGVTVSGVPASCAVASGVVCNFPSLAAGAEQDVALTIVSGNAGTVSFSATASTSGIESNTGNNVAAISTNFTAVVDLAITLRDDGAGAAQKQNYTLNVSNVGSITAHTVVVTVALPSGVIAGSDSPQCAQSDTQLVCALGNLDADANLSLTFTTVYLANGSFDLTASVGADEYDANTANNTAKVTTNVTSVGTDPNATSKKKGGGGLNAFLLVLLAIQYALRIRRRSRPR